MSNARTLLSLRKQAAITPPITGRGLKNSAKWGALSVGVPAAVATTGSELAGGAALSSALGMGAGTGLFGAATVGAPAGLTAYLGYKGGNAIADKLADKDVGIWNANPNGIKSGQKTLMHPAPSHEEVRQANLDRRLRALGRARQARALFTLPADNRALDVYRGTSPEIRPMLRKHVITK